MLCFYFMFFFFFENKAVQHTCLGGKGGCHQPPILQRKLNIQPKLKMIKLVIISFHSKEQHSKNVSFSFATKCQEESIPELVWQLHDALRGLDFPSLPSRPFLARRFCSHGYKMMAPISGIIYIPGRMEGTKSSVKNS